MQFFRLFFILTGFIVIAWSSYGQGDGPSRRRNSRIIDDSTKQVYGPRTSRYFFEKDVFYNRHYHYPIDTAIHNYHRFNYVQRYNNMYQDLGNIGTAIRPIYYQTPLYIGVTSGFNAFDLYWESEAIRYYDTKSPYSDLRVILGGLGRSITKVAFSRNITPRWNFGFDFKALLIDKQIQRTGKGDRNVRNTYYDLFTSYQSKDSTYRLFINFRRNHYQADEYGGVQPQDNYADYFDKDALPWLTNAESRERRNNFHLFHQYQVFGKGFQLYHVLDSYYQNNHYYDVMSTDLNQRYFDPVVVDSAQVKDGARFKTLRNEVGLKGNLAKLFYNGYYAFRHYNMDYQYYDDGDVSVPINGNEHYLGGRMALLLDSIGEINGWAEIEAKGNFRIEGSIRSRWFEASLKQMQYAPGFLQQAYRGSHDEWNNNFDPVKVTRLNGYLHYKSRVFSISPGFTFTTLADYVYFKYDSTTGDPQTVLPVQSPDPQVIASPEVRLSLTFFKHLTLSGQCIYTRLLQDKDDDRAISIPELFVNGQLSYANIFFKGNMDMQVGFDVHWNSAYKALGYDPVIQQFYRQDFFTVPDFPVLDAFFNMKVKSGRIFVKYNNIIQAVTRSGYMPTPYYPGQRNVIDFGFDLMFYD